ncbi:heme ABC transporter ATP-binding protein [Halopenitus salinus]|uniref:Cobalamin import ATP-binding protein BtuD n=1 Tax=Halopenitus salinus TaxID=1198295 RepID=A0ABD5UY10_9EURY
MDSDVDDAVEDSPPAIRVRDLTVSFGDLTVLSGVSLSVDRGTFLGLVGPNGAGKTTLLRTLRGTLAPDRGTVTLGGDDVATLSASAIGRRVASVPQETSLPFSFGVEQVVEMGRTPHLSRFDSIGSDDREAIERAMDRTDVSRFRERSIESVSGGERQRVLLARALAQETSVLLLDEPTGSLDINHAVRTLELVRELVADGKTVVAAIHDLNLAARYCDELALLSDGSIRAAGPPRQVLTASTLRDAFDARTLVTDRPGTAAPLVTALPDDGEPREDETPPHVHVVGTGSRAATVVRAIAREGFEASVGVVPAGDAAAEAAREVGADPILVPAFSEINDEAAGAARDRAAEADALVVVGLPATGNRSVVESVPETKRLVVGRSAVEGVEAPTTEAAAETGGTDGTTETAGTAGTAALDDAADVIARLETMIDRTRSGR